MYGVCVNMCVCIHMLLKVSWSKCLWKFLWLSAWNNHLLLLPFFCILFVSFNQEKCSQLFGGNITSWKWYTKCWIPTENSKWCLSLSWHTKSSLYSDPADRLLTSVDSWQVGSAAKTNPQGVAPAQLYLMNHLPFLITLANVLFQGVLNSASPSLILDTE